jgi:hypothetical protein
MASRGGGLSSVQPGTGKSMTEEARRFVSDLVWNDRSFMSSRRNTASSARIWLRHTRFPTGARFPASGLRLSRARGAAGTDLIPDASSKPDETAPTGHRLFVREQFLCQQVPPRRRVMPICRQETRPVTNRERIVACHRQDVLRMPQPDRSIGLDSKFDAIGMRPDKHKLLFYPISGWSGWTARKTQG